MFIADLDVQGCTGVIFLPSYSVCISQSLCSNLYKFTQHKLLVVDPKMKLLKLLCMVQIFT